MSVKIDPEGPRWSKKDPVRLVKQLSQPLAFQAGLLFIVILLPETAIKASKS